MITIRPSATGHTRAEDLFHEAQGRILRRTDRMFAWLMLAQWLFAIGLSLIVSPYAWVGRRSMLHLHVYAAVFLGGAICSLPWLMVWLRRGALETRLTIACAQALWSALLIHLTGGRIETHFHVFGSLAILAFYRDVRVLAVATVVIATDHFARGLIWPESVYGVANPEWWRFLEHAAWVVFLDVFLVAHCLQGTQEMHAVAERQAEVELLSESERDKSLALDRALVELKASQETAMRSERLAAVGQLAASVGHELRNPLTAVRNAHTFIGKRIEMANGKPLAQDERVKQFRGIIDRELDACSKIISDLLDFARGRRPERQPCLLRPLVAEAIEVVPKRANVTIQNQVSDELPAVEVDRDQFRQVLVNLVQNASEAFAEDAVGHVRVLCEQVGGSLELSVSDDGPGMPADVVDKIFQPLFSTKTKGTGLGLAIVQGSLERHGASIRVETQVGQGTRFVVCMPPPHDSALPPNKEPPPHAHPGC